MANKKPGLILFLCLMGLNGAKSSVDSAQCIPELPISKPKLGSTILVKSLTQPVSKTKSNPQLDVTHRIEDVFRYQLITGSNVLPFSFMSKMAFGGYISPQTTENIESNLQNHNRAGYMQSMGVVLYPLSRRFHPEQYNVSTVKSEVVSIGIRNIQMAGATFSNDAYRWIFRGNGYYKGQNLDVGSNHFYALGMNTVDFGISVPKAKRIERLYFSLAQISQFNVLKTQDVSLYTSPLADTVVMNGRFYSQSTAGLSAGQKGLGILMTMDRKLYVPLFGSQKTEKNAVYYGVRDLGVLFLPTLGVDSRGYIWDESTKGLKPAGESQIKPISVTQAVVSSRELQFGNWFTSQRDTLNARLKVVSQTRSGTVLSPFTLYANKTLYTRYLSGVSSGTEKGLGKPSFQTLELNLTYLHIPGYTLCKTLSWSSYYKPRGAQKWTLFYSEYYLGLGGFDTWNLGYKGFLNANLIGLGQTSFILDFKGIEAWIFPKRQHGAGISVGVRCKL